MRAALWFAALVGLVLLVPALLLRAAVGVFSVVAKALALTLGMFCLVVAFAVLGAVVRVVAPML